MDKRGCGERGIGEWRGRMGKLSEQDGGRKAGKTEDRRWGWGDRERRGGRGRRCKI